VRSRLSCFENVGDTDLQRRFSEVCDVRSFEDESGGGEIGGMIGRMYCDG
jgi:hypothetical protein